MANPIQRIKQFYGEVVQEVKKCSWPSRPELTEHTALIIVALILMTLFIFAVDNVCRYGIDGIFALARYLTN